MKRILRLLFFTSALAVAGVAATTQPAFRVERPSPTADKPQSKLWFAADSWWALLPAAQSPTLWQRTAQGWIEHAAIRTELAGVPGRTDVWFDRDGVTAVAIERDTFAIIRLAAVGTPVTTWRAQRLATWTWPSPEPIETATIARDGMGRWWVAAPVSQPVDPLKPRPAHGPDRDIVVWTANDAVAWQQLAPIARSVNGDDICTVARTPDGIGVAWSDQNRDEVMLARHSDGAGPAAWEPVERIASGGKTADDHLHAALTADGTLWLATKNSLDERNQPQLVLRVREARGGWQNHSYASREQGIEPSRPVVVATESPGTVLLGHTIYNRADAFGGSIVFGRVNLGHAQVIPGATAVIAPDPALRSRINDITAPKAPFPRDAAWIVLASDAEGRVFEADLRSLARDAAASAEAELSGKFEASAAQPPAIHRGEIMRQLEPLMLQQAQYLVSLLRPWPNDSQAAMLPPTPNRPPSGEHGIRPSAHTAKGLALLARLAPEVAFPAAFSRSAARDHALSILRCLIRTHGASGEVCADGKPWRAQWQSAYWAALAGEAAWLLWDQLSPTERWLAARMVCDEADRFVDVTPPANLANDSKAEENAWNSAVVSLAFNMFPRHPHHAAWRETAIRWIASSFATTRDLGRTDLVDGRPLREWLSGANLHDDFTLENHSRVHPDYMACTYLLTSQVPMFAWGQNPPPAAIHLNVEAINTNLKRLATPDGSVAYPNGQDWGLHRNIDWFEFHATAAVLYQDRQSAALMRHSLAAVRRMAARTPAGAVYLSGETKLSSDQAMVLEYLAHSYALMAQLGEGPAPLPDAELWGALAGTHVFPAGKFALVRTSDSLATFSWGAQVMGLVLPLRGDLLLTPETRGLIGYVGVEGAKSEIPVVKDVALAGLAAGFGVTGVLARGEGALEQRFGFLALPDGRVVYVDRVTAQSDAKFTALDFGTVGVLNDLDWPFHHGRRTLAHAGGTREFAATNATREAPVELSSPWFNLDGLGIVCLDVSGPARYVPAPTSAAGRLEQRFHLNASSAASLANTKTGSPVAHCVLVFLPNRTPEQTQAATARCALLSAPAAADVRVCLDDGTLVSFDLPNLRLTVTSGARTTSNR